MGCDRQATGRVDKSLRITPSPAGREGLLSEVGQGGETPPLQVWGGRGVGVRGRLVGREGLLSEVGQGEETPPLQLCGGEGGQDVGKM
jgi:hypothetical protein